MARFTLERGQLAVTDYSCVTLLWDITPRKGCWKIRKFYSNWKDGLHIIREHFWKSRMFNTVLWLVAWTKYFVFCCLCTFFYLSFRWFFSHLCYAIYILISAVPGCSEQTFVRALPQLLFNEATVIVSKISYPKFSMFLYCLIQQYIA